MLKVTIHPCCLLNVVIFPSQADGTHYFKFTHGYKKWSDYLKEMRKDGTWGDNIMLIAAANLYRWPIKVITSLPHNKEILIMPVQVPDKHVVDNPLVLGHIAEDHYVSLAPVQGNLLSQDYKHLDNKYKNIYIVFTHTIKFSFR